MTDWIGGGRRGGAQNLRGEDLVSSVEERAVNQTGAASSTLGVCVSIN
jgi:hypothetical protein